MLTAQVEAFLKRWGGLSKVMEVADEGNQRDSKIAERVKQTTPILTTALNGSQLAAMDGHIVES